MPTVSGMERSASSARARDRGIRPAQQVRQLGGVGDRLVPVAVVYARFSGVLTRENAGEQRPSGDIYPDMNRPSRRSGGPGSRAVTSAEGTWAAELQGVTRRLRPFRVGDSGR